MRLNVKVRVERIRRGRRVADVEYLQTEQAPQRRRPPVRQPKVGEPVRDPWEQDREVSTRLRLPWQRDHQNRG